MFFKSVSYDLEQFLKLDDRTCRNLELLTNLQTRDRKGSLIAVLDKTGTAMGSRKLKHWLRHPLMNREEIELRSGAIQRLIDDAPHVHQTLATMLKSVNDLERLGSKVSMGQGNARDLLASEKLAGLFTGTVLPILGPPGSPVAQRQPDSRTWRRHWKG